jgi:hypothetical protein
MVTQPGALVVLYPHPEVVVTETEPFEPPEAAAASSGLRLTTQLPEAW